MEDELAGLKFKYEPEEFLNDSMEREAKMKIMSDFYHSDQFDQFGFLRYQLRQRFKSNVIKVRYLELSSYLPMYSLGSSTEIWIP